MLVLPLYPVTSGGLLGAVRWYLHQIVPGLAVANGVAVEVSLVSYPHEVLGSCAPTW